MFAGSIWSRLEQARETFRSRGAELREFYLTTGRYDGVAVVEAPDDTTQAKLPCRSAAWRTAAVRRCERSMKGSTGRSSRISPDPPTPKRMTE
jgi:hypothetical protein